MPRWWSIILPFLLLLAGCGGGDPKDHGHKDHDHKDHDHKDHDHKGHEHKDHGHDHDHSGPNAHLWLDPILTRQFVEAIAWPLGDAVAGGKKPRIVVSIHPVASMVSELVGDRASVTTMLPQGGSPHGFELTPNIMKAVSEADVLVIVGLSMDPWAEKAAASAAKKDIKILRFADLISEYQEGHIKPLPADHPLAANAKAITAKIDTLHEKYKAALADIKTKQLVTFHNAFDLLAKRYGLEVVAHLAEMDLPTGSEVTPGALREARDAVKKHQLKTLYAEPQYPDNALHAIAEATGVKVLRLDDLGGPDREGYRTYFEMMESNLKVLVEGQSR